MGALGVIGIMGAMVDPASFQAIGWIVVSLAALAMGVNAILKLFDRFREKPVPAETYMPRTECRIIHEALAKRLDKYEADQALTRAEFTKQLERMQDDFKASMAKMDERAEERIASVHNRLNALGETINGRLGEVRGQLDRMKE